MTIGEEATKTGAEERMEIMADVVVLEGGADFEAEGVFEGASEVVEEGTVEGGKMNDNRWEGGNECFFDQPSDVIYLCTLNTFSR